MSHQSLSGGRTETVIEIMDPSRDPPSESANKFPPVLGFINPKIT